MPHRHPPFRWLAVTVLMAGAAGALSGLLSVAAFAPPARAASPLLERVKQNPQLAKTLCRRLRRMNEQGIRSTSPQATEMVARRLNLSSTDAEILTTYVVGLHCPDVN